MTGGAGFIGSNFIEYWFNGHSGDEIINLDNFTYAGNFDNLKRFDGDKRHKLFIGDICSERDVEEAMAGVEIVVHFAAESHVDRSIASSLEFVRTNVLGTQVLLDEARKQKVKRFHHVSTDEVFGSLELDSEGKFDETTSYAPHSPYSASKAASDHLARAAFFTHGLPVTISNCSNNFGPFQYPEKLLPLAITNLIEGKKIPVYGDGKNVRDWIYVEDHCRGIGLVLEKGTLGETYCLGGRDGEIDNLSLLRKVLAIMGSDKNMLEFVADRKGHDRRYAISWEKAKYRLGYEPRWSLDSALEKTVSWYKQNRGWWALLKRRLTDKS